MVINYRTAQIAIQYMTSSSKSFSIDSLGRLVIQCSAVFPSFATGQSKRVINTVLTSDTFSATQGIILSIIMQGVL